jgi:ATP-dependent Clp protease ATP-binding subunit ClpA
VFLPSPEALNHDAGMTELSGKVEELLREASDLAEATGHAIVGTEHLLLAMTRQSKDSFARRLLDEVGATEPLRARIEDVIGAG